MRVSAPRRFPVLALVAVTAFVAVTLVFTSSAGAQACPPNKTAAECVRAGLGTTANTAGLGTEATPLPEIIGNIIYAALSLTGIIFVLLVIYGGFMWMQARGNQEDVQKAKKILESAIIGIVITALAFAITQFVMNRIIEAQTPGVEVVD
jgi:predicted permease